MKRWKGSKRYGSKSNYGMRKNTRGKRIRKYGVSRGGIRM